MFVLAAELDSKNEDAWRQVAELAVFLARESIEAPTSPPAVVAASTTASVGAASSASAASVVSVAGAAAIADAAARSCGALASATENDNSDDEDEHEDEGGDERVAAVNGVGGERSVRSVGGPLSTQELVRTAGRAFSRLEKLAPDDLEVLLSL